MEGSQEVDALTKSVKADTVAPPIYSSSSHKGRVGTQVLFSFILSNVIEAYTDFLWVLMAALGNIHAKK